VADASALTREIRSLKKLHFLPRLLHNTIPSTTWNNTSHPPPGKATSVSGMANGKFNCGAAHWNEIVRSSAANRICMICKGSHSRSIIHASYTRQELYAWQSFPYQIC
jgi:hypothetical protein